MGVHGRESAPALAVRAAGQLGAGRAEEPSTGPRREGQEPATIHRGKPGCESGAGGVRLRQATGGRVGLDSWAFRVPAAGLWAAEAWAEAASGAGEWATDRKEAREGERVPAIARMPSTCVTMRGTCGQHLMRSLPTRTLRLGSHCEADSREATSFL